MDIERELQRVIDSDIEAWRERKDHKAVFSAEADNDGLLIGSLFIDGRPFHAGLMVEAHWVSITEARAVAKYLGVILQVA